MEDSQNAALFQVLMTLLGYTPVEQKRMQLARERKLGQGTLWGQLVGT